MAANILSDVGPSMPTNSFDLMRQLRAAEKLQNSNHLQQQQENRLYKIELRNQSLETQLMYLEDYFNSSEGERRSRAQQDRINMWVL